MALAIVFTPSSMTAEKYEEIIRRLEAAGAGSPAGRLYHVCYGSSDGLQVTDVWDSMETFDEFGKILMPILQELGVNSGEPVIKEVHNIIQG